MTEWEQMKTEYKEIEIPKDGPHQVMAAMARAKRQRKRFKQLAGYGTIVAAALLILVLPRMLGQFSAENDSALFAADGGAFTGAAPESATMTADPVTNLEKMEVECGNSEDTDTAPMYDAADTTVTESAVDSSSEGQNPGELLSDGELEKISHEILRQMKESEETYFIKSEEYPDGFERISEEQSFYINEAGQLVVVFAEGAVAPDAMGTVEFVIPKEIYKVEERNE